MALVLFFLLTSLCYTLYIQLHLYGSNPQLHNLSALNFQSYFPTYIYFYITNLEHFLGLLPRAVYIFFYATSSFNVAHLLLKDLSLSSLVPKNFRRICTSPSTHKRHLSFSKHLLPPLPLITKFLPSTKLLPFISFLVQQSKCTSLPRIRLIF